MKPTQMMSFRIDEKTLEQLNLLSSKRNITTSNLIRELIEKGLDKELSSESVDFIREQIADEIKNYCDPQFNRIASLQAKIGYKAVACFELLVYIIASILPTAKRQSFEDMQRQSKALAISYLKFSEKETATCLKAETKAVKELKIMEDLNND